MLNTKDVLLNIRKAFLEQDRFLIDSYIPEFVLNGEFLGDSYNQIIVEPKGKKPPRFYYNISPFDTISGKAPDRALVFENGELLLNTDFTEYIKVRTGSMDALVLQQSGAKSLKDKKILYLGSGGTAQQSLKALKSTWTDLDAVDCISQSGNIEKLNALVPGVKVRKGTLDTIGIYDYIFCHTNTKQTILKADYIEKIKSGAQIHTFISSTEHGEVADEFYNTQKANIIVDWQQTLQKAKDLVRAIESGNVNKTDVIYLKDFFLGTRKLSKEKRFTIYRSSGTPLQNLAILQLLERYK